MTELLPNEDYAKRRIPGTNVYAPSDLSLEELTTALKEPGETLKQSKKATTRRVNNWIIKNSSGPALKNTLKFTFRREHYRSAWYAAHYLLKRDIKVPQPIAYLERSHLGCITGNTFVTENLADHRSAPRFLQALGDQGAEQETITRFLEALAGTIQALEATGAYHADLAAKNILTSDGETFYFIDLDAITLDQPYTNEMRLKNHVQLYDSFCDYLNDSLLVPFIQRMLPQDIDARVWLPALRTAQTERRRFIRKPWRPRQKMPKV